MRHALADLEGWGRGVYYGILTMSQLQPLVKKSDKAKQKNPEEMKREKRESVERLFYLCVCVHIFITEYYI